MTETLGTSDFYDTAAFAVPPTVAPMDAVRKAAARLGTVTGMGETAAMTVAEAVVDLAALRASLNEPLPGLTATSDAHLRVIRTRVWTPWVTPPADQIDRYGSQKIFPLQDPSVPNIAQAEGASDGLVMEWATPADRDWHLNDNEEIYGRDVYAERLRLFPDKGGIITPMVLIPQTETFTDGSDALHLLRIVDGRRRYYAVQSMLRQFSGLDADSLAAHLGSDITLDDVSAALTRDRVALTKVVRAIREACTQAGDGNDFRNLVGVHYMASAISVPAHIIVGTVDPVTTEVTPLGTEASSTLSIGMIRWHSGSPAQVISTGQQECNGLLLPQAYIDQEMIDNTARRLRARGVPKNVIEFGTQAPRQAARFVWWCRATAQFNGSPATAVAGFAQQVDGSWPQSISRPLLACAAHLMEEDRDSVYSPGDYRKAEVRPDSLSMLVTDAQNLEAVAAVSDDGHGGLLVHPRFRNASHIALAHLALSGALPDKQPLPERIVTHTRLLSQVARSLAGSQMPAFVRPSGATYLDERGQAVVIDERTLNRNDLPWPKKAAPVSHLMPPQTAHPFSQASHVFALRHEVTYTIPFAELEGGAETIEEVAAVVRRWFPDATGIALTDTVDKFVTGVMVGSVFVRLFDRQAEEEDARSRGVWYPKENPVGTKDTVDFEAADSGAPAGFLAGAGNWLKDEDSDQLTSMANPEEQWYMELSDEIVDAIYDLFQEKSKNFRHEAPVLELPALKEVR